MFVFSLITGCTDKGANDSKTLASAIESEEKEAKEVLEFSDEDVTIGVATPWGEEYFMKRIGDYVEEKNPHITIEHIDWDGTVENLEASYAAGIVPDAFLAFSGQQPLGILDSVYPLDDMLASYNIDLSYVEPLVLDEIRSRDKERRLVGIPQEVGQGE